MKVRFETAAGKDSKNTAVVEDSLSPFWDETMTFDFDIASQYQLDTQKAYIEVWDSDRVKDEQIGSFELGSIVLAFLSRCLAMVCVVFAPLHCCSTIPWALPLTFACGLDRFGVLVAAEGPRALPSVAEPERHHGNLPRRPGVPTPVNVHTNEG